MSGRFRRSPGRASPNFSNDLKPRIISLSKSNAWKKAIGEWDFARCELLEPGADRDKCSCPDHSPRSKVKTSFKVKGQFCIRNRETCQETYVDSSFIEEFMEIDTRDLMAGLNQIILNPTTAPNRALVDYVNERRSETPQKGHFVLSEWEKKFLQTTNDSRETGMTFKQRRKRIEINEKILRLMIVEKPWIQERPPGERSEASSFMSGRHHPPVTMGRHHIGSDSANNATMVPDDVRSEEGHQGQTVAAPPTTPESLGASAQAEIYGNVSSGRGFVYGVAASNSPNFSMPQIFGSWMEARQLTDKHCAVHRRFPNTQDGRSAAWEWTCGMGWVEESVVSKDRAIKNLNGQCKPTPEQTARYHTLFPEGFWSYFTKKGCHPTGRDLPRTLHMTGMNATAASSVPGTASRHSSATQERIYLRDDRTFKVLSPMVTRVIRTSNR